MKLGEFELNKIYCMDCLEGLKKLPDNSVDLLMTSPPFKEEDVEGDYWKFYDAFFKEALRVTSKVLIIIHSATKLDYLIKNYGPKRIMIWAKGFSQYSYRFNPILVYQLDEDYNINKRIWSDCFNSQSLVGDGKVHKYQDPLQLYSVVIKMFSDECKIIMDCFMGSGTLAVACKQLGKKFIGFEINPEYVKIANKRLNQEILI